MKYIWWKKNCFLLCSIMRNPNRKKIKTFTRNKFKKRASPITFYRFFDQNYKNIQQINTQTLNGLIFDKINHLSFVNIQQKITFIYIYRKRLHPIPRSMVQVTYTGDRVLPSFFWSIIQLENPVHTSNLYENEEICTSDLYHGSRYWMQAFTVYIN